MNSRKISAFLMGQKNGTGDGGHTIAKSTTGPNRLSVAVSTSALANLSTYQTFRKPSAAFSIPAVPEGTSEDNEIPTPLSPLGQPKLQLRKETLQSLGISVQRRHNDPRISPKGVLKKSGSAKSLARSNTLTNLKRVPTEIELSNGRVLKRDTSVTFNERVRCKGVQTASALAADPKDLWFQDDEMSALRRNLKKIIKQAAVETEQGMEKQEESDAFCLRGLERHLPGAKEESRMRMEDTWDAVLGAQDVYLEHTGEYCDNEKIESLVRSISRQSLKEAQDRAQRDAMEAQQ
jgi:hypothetical protein